MLEIPLNSLFSSLKASISVFSIFSSKILKYLYFFYTFCDGFDNLFLLGVLSGLFHTPHFPIACGYTRLSSFLSARDDPRERNVLSGEERKEKAAFAG